MLRPLEERTVLAPSEKLAADQRILALLVEGLTLGEVAAGVLAHHRSLFPTVQRALDHVTKVASQYRGTDP